MHNAPRVKNDAHINGKIYNKGCIYFVVLLFVVFILIIMSAFN